MCIAQDLEDEAVKLRTHKHPVTDRAQMLNQTLSVSHGHFVLIVAYYFYCYFFVLSCSI